MIDYCFLFLALYASIGVLLWLKVVSALFCILAGGRWSGLASRASNEVRDEIRDDFSESIGEFSESLSDLDQAINGRGLPHLVGGMVLSILVVAALLIELVKCVVAWPIVFRRGILSLINKLTSKK